MTNQPDFRKLLEAAKAKLPWEVHTGSSPIGDTGDYDDWVDIRSDEDAIAVWRFGEDGDEENAALIVAAVNALPAHLARIAELEAAMEILGTIVVQEAFDAGFMAAGEGWNGEYPGDAHTTEYYANARAASIAEIYAKHAGLKSGGKP